MIEPKVGQYWKKKGGSTELEVREVWPDWVRAFWIHQDGRNTGGTIKQESLQKNYVYDRTTPTSILTPFGDIYADLYASIVFRLETLDDAELITTLLATEELTGTNCAWTIYEIRGLVATEARRILNYHREQYQMLHCSKMTPHVPHMWTRPRPPVTLEGVVDNSAGRYYCRGRRIHEGGFRPVGVRVQLPT